MSFRKNVFILGAGFSEAAGMPLMNDFLTQARELRDDPRSKLSNSDREVFTKVIEYRFALDRALAKVSVDLDNIEQLFGFMEMDLQLGTDAEPGLRKAMTYLIARTLEASAVQNLPHGGRLFTKPNAQGSNWQFSFLQNQYRFFVGFVGGLWNAEKRDGQDSRDTLISFNYDLVLEREMVELQIAPNYHCGPAALSYGGAFGSGKSRLNLLKMHGAANWIICTECRKNLYFLTPEEAKVERVARLACPICNRLTLDAFILPPTWNKGIEQGFLRSVWAKALAEVTNAGRLFIIGYSFPETDHFFKYMLGLALARNNQLSKVYVVNPDSRVAEKFSGLFNQYFHERIVEHCAYPTTTFLDQRLSQFTRQEFTESELDLALFSRG